MKRMLTVAFALLFGCSVALYAQSSGSADNSAQTTPQAQAPQSDNSATQANPQSDQAAQPETKSEKKEAKAEKKEAKAAAKGKAMSLTGWVKDENGKTVFVNDKDKQSWDISNPDAVKGHEGHHVKIKAKLDEASHSLTVDSVKMMRKGKQSAETKKEKSS